MAPGVASDAAGRAARRLFASTRPHSKMTHVSSSRTAPLASSSDENSSSGGGSSDVDDDSLAVATVDVASLDEQIRTLRERVARLERDETDHDLVLGCERLAVRKERCVAQAYANHAMSQRRARAVFEHACERAKERYASRCARLQRAMDDELARELQRLQNAKAGVAVSSRRRRGVRPLSSSSSSYGEPASGPATASSAGLLSPPLPSPSMSVSTTRNDAGADNWYYYYGASFPLPSSDADGMQDSDVDDAVMDMSPADLAQRVRYEEKKRLDALLARPRVFAPLDQKLAEADVDADLLAIQHPVPYHGQSNSSLREGRSSSCRSASDQAHSGDKSVEGRAPASPHRRRRRVVTSRSLKRTPSANQASISTSKKTGTGLQAPFSRSPASSTSARLRVNPQMLCEGQEVAVYRRRPLPSTTSAGEEYQQGIGVSEIADSFDVPEGRMECELSGVIAAATSSHVFVLSVSGRFEPISVAEWAAGLVVIRAADTGDVQQRKRRRQELGSVK